MGCQLMVAKRYFYLYSFRADVCLCARVVSLYLQACVSLSLPLFLSIFVTTPKPMSSEAENAYLVEIGAL